MADREEEEHDAEVSEQFAEPVNTSKSNKDLELQVMCPLLLNLVSQENNPQPNEKPEELK